MHAQEYGESTSSHTLLYFSPDFACRYTETDVIPCSGESSKETAVKYVSVMCDDHSVFIYIFDKYELNSFQSCFSFKCFQMVNILWFVSAAAAAACRLNPE